MDKLSNTIFFEQFDALFNLSKNEDDIIDIWRKINLAQLIELRNKESSIFRFMDGPPFVSAEFLHIGHVLVSMIKDTVLKFKTMHGYHVMNKNGKDCHGLPIEMVVNKKLEVYTKEDVHNFGIGKYNAKCKEIISDFSGSWNHIFEKIGRTMDFNDEYKTMDKNFMESVWWVFNELWKKGLIYRSYKIMPFSTHCCTSLSNFEAGQNYKDVEDMTIFVKFPLKNDPFIKFVAWTTTPWTLPSNLALCVNPELEYVKIINKKNKDVYIICKDTINNIFEKSKPDSYEIIETFIGASLEGIEYIPPFEYFNTEDRKFKVISGKFVTATNGTGIVHIAPGFGEDDFNISIEKNVIDKKDIGKVCPVDDNGRFTNIIKDFDGMYIFDANPIIIDRLGKSKLLVKKQMYKHSYPFCWRTDTRLIYRAVSSFFVSVTQIKDKLIENNNKMNWTPSHVGSGRFHNWLDSTCDWGISRSRYFGTPLPVWMSDDGEEMVSIGSIQELIDLTGVTDLEDLHREFIDNLQIPSREGRGMLKRVEDVADCWFESGSVPYGQFHYPFENSHIFENEDFLSDFVCEGIDQTRGWFYTLLVLSTALFDKPPFKNVICTGLVLDENGNKISKKLGNFVHPITIVEKYGADALRLYLIGSPAAHGDSFKFRDSDVKIIEGKLFQLFNGVKFFLEYSICYKETNNKFFDIDAYMESNNVMDKWILSRVGTLLKYINSTMETYSIHRIPTEILNFIEDLINWYIKFNRNRIRGRYYSLEEQNYALSTLYKVFLAVTKIFAPFIPFFSETMYQKLTINKKDESIHLIKYPNISDFELNEIVERRMVRLQQVSYMVRTTRSRSSTAQSIKIPLKSITIAHNDPEFLNDILEMENYLKEEINTINVNYCNQEGLVNYKIKPNHKKLGTTYKQLSKNIVLEISKIDTITINNYINGIIPNLYVYVNDKQYILEKEDIDIVIDTNLNVKPNELYFSEKNTIVIIDTDFDSNVEELYIRRLFVGAVQRMRKNTKLRPWNKIGIYYSTTSKIVIDALHKYHDEIVEDLTYQIYFEPVYNRDEKIIISQLENICNNDVLITLTDLYSKQ